MTKLDNSEISTPQSREEYIKGYGDRICEALASGKDEEAEILMGRFNKENFDDVAAKTRVSIDGLSDKPANEDSEEDKLYLEKTHQTARFYRRR